MVTGTERRESWECGTCGVTSRNPRVGAVPMPPRWDRDGEGRPRCLNCSQVAAGIDPREAKRARRLRAAAESRKRARLEKEEEIADALLALAPADGPEVVAEAMEATGAGRGKVEEVRRTLRASGALPPGARSATAPKRRKPGEKAAKGRRVEEALRRDHRRTNAEIAAEAGTVASTVVAARKRLGLRWNMKGAARDVTHAALDRLGEVDHVAVGRELGIDPETARQRLNVLVRDGRADKRRNGRGVLYRAAA